MYLTETVSKCSIWDKITNSYNSFWITRGKWRRVYVRMLKDRKVRSMKNIFLPFIFFLKKKKNCRLRSSKETLHLKWLGPWFSYPQSSSFNSKSMICNSFRDRGLSFKKKPVNFLLSGTEHNFWTAIFFWGRSRQGIC